MAHGQHVHFSWHIFVMSLVFLPSQIFLWVYLVWVHAHCTFGGSLTHFPFPLGVGKLALNRQNFYVHVLGVVLSFLLPGWLYVCRYVCLSVIWTSICPYVCLLVHLYICHYIHTYLRALVS